MRSVDGALAGPSRRIRAIAPRPALAAASSSVSRLRAPGARAGVLLLDEPLSNLDAKLREQMRFEAHACQRELGITTSM